ncbi:MAG: hypothetical protein Ta2F_11630 [Termitinemataceae bacterium]|nr:MAG: hypothetical protein Ta2F_11630 [Termitinemataceae bacterium]
MDQMEEVKIGSAATVKAGGVSQTQMQEEYLKPLDKPPQRNVSLPLQVSLDRGIQSVPQKLIVKELKNLFFESCQLHSFVLVQHPISIAKKGCQKTSFPIFAILTYHLRCMENHRTYLLPYSGIFHHAEAFSRSRG